MSAVRPTAADSVSGFLAALSLAVSAIALVRQPGLLAPAAIVVAVVAARMTTSHRTLAGIAVAVGGLAFLVGMSIAVVTDNPLF